LANEPVGHIGVARQQRAVQVGTDGTTTDGSFGAVRTVVAEAGCDPPQWLGSRSETGPAAVVLEADDLAPTGAQPHVADQPTPRRPGDGVEDANPGYRFPAECDVLMAEQLVTPADGQQRRTVVKSGTQGCGVSTDQRPRDARLGSVLSATDEEDVDVLRDRVGRFDRPDAHLEPSPPGTLGKRQDVAPITVGAQG
jgi:hypothetical protein